MNIIIRPEEVDSDLFAGGGGASLGHDRAMKRANRTRRALVAVNHDAVALSTHRRNFPWATHYREDIKRVNPLIALDGKRARKLIAAPDCSGFSQGLGKRMMNEGVRALAWDVVRWARLTQPESILVENVMGFLEWGPLYPDNHPDPKKAGRQIPERKGEYFNAFLKSLRDLGYRVSWRLLRACDYGDPTSRVRLFIQCQRQKPICWPAPTHGEADNLFGLPPHVAAETIIDWDLPTQSIFERKKKLVDSTEARIAEGIMRFCGDPFLYSSGGPTGRQKVHDLSRPYHTALTECHDYICQPVIAPADALPDRAAQCAAFLIRYNDKGRVQSLKLPLTTLDTSNRFMLVTTSFLVGYYGNGHAHALTAPVPTLTTRDRYAFVEVQQALAARGMAIVDIRTRMLADHECARAHSFPADFVFEGTRGEIIEQVGHSWPVEMATAVLYAMETGEGEVIQ